MKRLLNYLFGCTCSNTSRVFTVGRWPNKHSYVVCLDCGKEIPHSLLQVA